MKDELPGLAAKVEAAEGPTFELMSEAFDLCFPKPKTIWNDLGNWTDEYFDWHARQSAFCAFLEVGAWVDAALSLVPEDMRDEIEITTLYRVARVGINLNHGEDGSPFYGSNESNSIALALTAAAIRARSENPA